MRAPPYVASAFTERTLDSPDQTPSPGAPSGCHAVPFQAAIRLAEAPPAVVKTPPATSSPPYTASEVAPYTGVPPASPLPNGCHQIPFQREIFGAGMPPATRKSPPATRSPP